jgi:hypothetical protein
MNLKALFHWFYEKLRNYNLFIPEINVHDDDDEPAEPATVVKHQRYSTWLYVLLLTGK